MNSIKDIVHEFHELEHEHRPGPVSSSGVDARRATVAISEHETPHSSSPRKKSDSTSTVPIDLQSSNVPPERPQPYVRRDTGISVPDAQDAFSNLERHFSNISQQDRKLPRVRDQDQAPDVEKSPSSSQDDEAEPFNLEATLRGAREQDIASGIRSKEIGICWDGLTVRGVGGLRNIVKTFPDAFIDFALAIPRSVIALCGWTGKGSEFDIIQNCRGLVKPGEMCLVLGRPGSGCTTFLKTIANQRAGYTSIDGDVLYGPYSAKEFAKRYRGEAIYSPEDDIHHATLTVAQTLGFALDVKTPDKRPGGMSKRDFKARIVDLLLKMFGMEHTRNTIVGDAFTRGCSGGERKRVSIMEGMITGASICAWDNSTRGLDASTALDYAKSLRIMTNIYKTTTFSSLYQTAESIYTLFDSVMVLDQGRLAFFGKTTEARAYFEQLGFKEKPRQTTADFLTGCTDAFEREFKHDMLQSQIPHTPDMLAAAFAQSKHSDQLDRQLVKYRQQLDQNAPIYEDFAQANLESKRGTKSVYSVPFYLQIWALMRRQFLIKWQGKFNLAVAWTTSIIIAIVVGTVYLRLPLDSAGAFTRGGVLFFALLYNAFTAFSELAGAMLGRPIVNKHRAYAFYRPSALWIGQTLVDTAFASALILVFSIIVYFMCGLVLSAGAFFTFYLYILSAYLAISLFFRSIAVVSPDFNHAIKLASAILTAIILMAGYLIQYRAEKVWLRWIFYVSPLGLSFSSMMINEFSRITITCDGRTLIPNGPGYNDLRYQVCTLPGSTAGTPTVYGGDYISAAFSYNLPDQWRNWGIVLALAAFCLFINVTAGEALQYGAGGSTVTYYQKENAKRKELNQGLLRKRRNRNDKQVIEATPLNVASKAVLTWEALTYDVTVAKKPLRLLSDVYGYCEPGKLTALMGASGAGKTTLLDVLASRKTTGVIGGDILIDGRPPGTAFQRGTAYAEQLDLIEPTQTVREAFRFSASLRQPCSVPVNEKEEWCEEVISLLELENVADAIVGSSDTGLSVEARKRVTIGIELAAKPELLLFLDEPTSGLDSQSAFNIIRFLKKLTLAGQNVLCTIHQPNSALFSHFDRLLLLERPGRVVYFGEIGKDASTLLNYFSRYGANLTDPSQNPAEWMLDIIGAGTTPRFGPRDWADIWLDSPEFKRVKTEIEDLKAHRREAAGFLKKFEDREYATPLWHQIKVVNARTHLSYWRTPSYGFGRLYTHVVVALISGLTYLNLGDSRTDLQYVVFLIFLVTILPGIILPQVMPKYDIARMIFYRESAAKAYRQFPFALACVIAEVPYAIICAIAFFALLYYLPGLQRQPSRAGYQFFMILLTSFFSTTLGQMLAALTPSSFVSLLLNPFIINVFGLFCGVTVPPPQIPGFWRAWLYPLNPMTRLVEGMVVTALQDRVVVCTPEELNRFAAPPGMDCGTYMRPFFERGGPGYIVSNTSTMCEYCAYSVGQQFFGAYELSFGHRWRDLGILAAFIGSNLIILFLASRFLNYNRR